MFKVEERLQAGDPAGCGAVLGMLLKANATAGASDAGVALLEPYYTAYDRRRVVDWFAAPPAGASASDLWPFREADGRWGWGEWPPL